MGVRWWETLRAASVGEMETHSRRAHVAPTVAFGDADKISLLLICWIACYPPQKERVGELSATIRCQIHIVVVAVFLAFAKNSYHYALWGQWSQQTVIKRLAFSARGRTC